MNITLEQYQNSLTSTEEGRRKALAFAVSILSYFYESGEGEGIEEDQEISGADLVDFFGQAAANHGVMPSALLSAPEVQSCGFVESSSLVPQSWASWFWGLISDSAPFSWGENNRSLVCACDFARHCRDRLLDAPDGVEQSEIDAFLASLDSLGSTYIDLEN